ncbi:hypothetical protein D047_1055B, partial [Vibrio parahaemolyticus VPTS-2010_2]
RSTLRTRRFQLDEFYRRSSCFRSSRKPLLGTNLDRKNRMPQILGEIQLNAYQCTLNLGSRHRCTCNPLLRP